jgi:hypothetical protein
MLIKNPDAPATQKQLIYLKKLTDIDYSDRNLSVQQASDIISKVSTPEGLMRFELERTKEYVIDDSVMPFSEPQNTLIEGNQRSGKTMTGVARIADKYDNDCVRVFLEKEGVKDFKVIGFDLKNRTAKVKLSNKPEIIKIPASYKLVAELKIFCNLHLYGMKYVYCPSFKFIIQGLKSGLIADGELLMDEYYMGAFNRESMTEVARELSKNSNQYAKKMLRTTITAPMASQLDWSARLLPTTHIQTEYNKKTKIVSCYIKKKGDPGTKVVTYDSLRYRNRYWTNESIHK